MELEKIYDTHKLNTKKLLNQDFIKEKNTYIKTYDIRNHTFSVTFYITEKTTKIKVYDKELQEEYLPFYIESQTGEYVLKIREEVESIWKEIINTSFEIIDRKEQVLSYIEKKYKVRPAYLWENDKTTAAIRNKDNKWFGIIMEIPYKTLNIDKNGKVYIINLKNKEEKVKDLIDNKNYFPAYHMNKKYWFTILLTKNTKLEEIEKLIDESYNLVNKKKS